MRIIGRLAIMLVFASCAQQAEIDASTQMNPLAERYVHLALALGEHDEHYVDAYFGPDEWRDHARDNAKTLSTIIAEAKELAALLSYPPTPKLVADL